MKLVPERKVNSAFWGYALEEEWTREEKLLYLYLLTNEDTAPPTYEMEVGQYKIKYEINLETVAKHVDCSIETIKRTLDVLSKVYAKVHFKPTEGLWGIITISD